MEAFFVFKSLEPLVLTFVIILVIILGYVKIFKDFSSEKKPKNENVKSKHEYIEWADICNEFKMAIYNLASAIKKSLEPKKNKRKK